MTPQQLVALQLANSVRCDGAQVRKELRIGTLSVTEALDDPRAGVLTIGAVMASPRWRGPKRAGALCADLQITPTRRVRDLTERQKRLITLREALR